MSFFPNTQPQAGSFLDNLVVNQLITQMNPGIVYQLSNRQRVFNFALRMINQQSGGSKAIYTKEIVSASRGLDFIRANVQTRSLVNNKITLTFDAPVDGIRENDQIYYGIEWGDMGRVESFQNGQGGFAVIAPLYGQTFTASSFPVGSNVGIFGDSSVIIDSPAKGRRFLNPKLDFNYTSTTREGHWNARREKISTRVTSNGTQPDVFTLNGQWYEQGHIDMLNRLEFTLEMNRLFQERAEVIDNSGTRTTNGGVRWTIKNRGGIYAPFSTPITRSWFEAQLGAIYDQNIDVGGQYMLFTGRGFWASISSLYEQTIIQAGILNTWGGQDVSGFNIPLFTIPGVNKTIAVVEMPLFNEPILTNGIRCQIPGYQNYTRLQMTAFLMQDSLLRASDGRMLPQFTQYHYGPSEYLIGQLRGIDQATYVSMAPTEIRDRLTDNPLDVATLRDLTQMNVLTDSGIDGYGYGAAWFEPTI